MIILSAPSTLTTIAAPDNVLDLVNLDHSRIIWFGIFALICGVSVFFIRIILSK